MKLCSFSLLSKVRQKEGKFVHEGPMGPILGAGDAIKSFQEVALPNSLCSHIVRINWKDPYGEMLNENEGLPMKPELTGFDTIVLIFQKGESRIAASYQDRGDYLLPIALHFEGDKESTLTQAYINQKEKYVKHPEDKDWDEIMNNVLAEYPILTKEEVING